MAKPRTSRTAATATAPGDKPGAKLVCLRSAEWREHQLRWRWLLDSLEGGDRYRQAIYGADSRGMPVRNLVRHKREYPEPSETRGSFAGGYAGNPAGSDPAFAATDDDYELRRARTPVPTFLAEAIHDQVDRVYAREVDRAGPAPLLAWWLDVDGMGTPVDHWMHKTLAPILLALGQVDVLIDRPAAPEGEDVWTQADVLRLGLDRAVATYVLPENMVWWRLDAAGRYAECLVREYPDGDDVPTTGYAGGAAPPRDPACFRHWTAGGSTLYDADGRELARAPHPYGLVPIVRLFAGRKVRCRNVGQSPFEGFAEKAREYYNRDSELILSDTLQAHPLLSGPEEYIEAGSDIPIGPGYLLPKKRNSQGTSVTYEGFEYIDPPKGAAESLRENKHDLLDGMDRDSATAKPAGTHGVGSGVVSQSGLSKSLDNEKLFNKLAGIATALAESERAMAALALVVLGVDVATEAVTIGYSRQFDLSDVEDLGQFITEMLAVVANPAAADLPTLTAEFLGQMVRQALPGRDDATYNAWDAEVVAALAKAKADAEASKAAAAMAATSQPGGMP